jgi:hypothetical protein
MNKCKDHPTIFFGSNVNKLLEDDGWEFTDNGCIHTELIIQKWKETFDPVDTIKEEKGAYSILRKFVNSNTVSGVFYRSTDYFEEEELDIGMKLSYLNILTSWSQNIKEAWKYNKTVLLKLYASNIKGIDISNRDENTFILGEITLEILSKENYKDGTLITVQII